MSGFFPLLPRPVGKLPDLPVTFAHDRIIEALDGAPDSDPCPWLDSLLAECKTVHQVIIVSRQHERVCGYCRGRA